MTLNDLRGRIFFDLGFTEVNKDLINPTSDIPKLRKGWSMPGYAEKATYTNLRLVFRQSLSIYVKGRAKHAILKWP